MTMSKWSMSEGQRVPEVRRHPRSGRRFTAGTTSPGLQLADRSGAITVPERRDRVSSGRRRVLTAAAALGAADVPRTPAERRVFVDAMAVLVAAGAPQTSGRRSVRMSRAEAAKRGLLASDGRPNYSAWAAGVQVV